MVKVLIALLVLVLADPAVTAAEEPRSRTQIEHLLATELPSGSSAAMVARFLDARGVAHGQPEPSGASVILLGTFEDVAGSRPTDRGRLQVRFAFLQDRLIGYSFTDLPASR